MTGQELAQNFSTIIKNVRAELNAHTDIVSQNARLLARDLGSFRNSLVIFVSVVWILALVLDFILKMKNCNTSNFFAYATGAMATILGFYFTGRIVSDKNGNGNKNGSNGH